MEIQFGTRYGKRSLGWYCPPNTMCHSLRFAHAKKQKQSTSESMDMASHVGQCFPNKSNSL